MKTIKVKELDSQSFAPYGKIINTEGIEPGGNPKSHFWYPQVVCLDTPTSINMMTVIPREMISKDLEAHDHTSENLFGLDGDIVVVVAKEGKPDTSKMDAFLVRQGTGVSISPKVWHYVPFPVDKEVMCACIFKKNTSHEDIYFDSFDEEVKIEF